jgi:hypothetical protein
VAVSLVDFLALENGYDVLAIFAVSALTSAFLLFWVEPLFARLVLPLLGGAPAVWNTCLMYFQALLLLGYLYAHASSRYLAPRKQIVVHVALLLVSALALPVAIPAGWSPPGSGNVIFWLLGVLSVAVGAPFLVLSATAPLLQRWLASLDHPIENPYVLYAASNAGSFLGLLAFPLLLEPNLRLGEQSRLWTVVYLAAICLVGLSGVTAWKRIGAATPDRRPASVASPEWSTRFRWLALAFIPSSLLLSVTTFLSTDIAATPLLWVIPLSMYLLTFVIVFARGGERLRLPAAFVHALLMTAQAIVIFLQMGLGFRLGYTLYLGVFLFTTLVLHGELAASRPHPAHLTEYYLWIALGGALGGAFTALIVPLIFKSARDYTLMLVLACFFRPVLKKKPGPATIALAVLPALVLLQVAKPHVGDIPLLGTNLKWIAAVLAAVAVMFLWKTPIRFGLAIASLSAVALFTQHLPQAVFRDRSFFGIYRVMNDAGPSHVLYHGTTIHGAQFLDKPLEPLTYFHRKGPVGQLLDSIGSTDTSRKVGIVGLGAGSLLCYSRPGEDWTFFEIDPAVEAIARNPQLFSFLSACAVRPRIVLGDARLTLAREQPGKFSILVLDAFSSDAIPVHLLTREALALYMRSLKENGLLIVHISNRRLRLEPVVAAVTADAGLFALTRHHRPAAGTDRNKDFEYGAVWVAIARQRSYLAPLLTDNRWRPLEGATPGSLWTDDYSNLFSVIRW